MAKTQGKEVKDLKDVVDASTESTDTEATDTTTETEPKTYSQEDADALVKSALDEQYKELNKRLTNLGEVNAMLREKSTQPQASSVTKTMKAMLDEMTTGDGFSDDPARQGRIQTLKTELAREEQFQTQQTLANQQREELNQKIKTAGLDPTDEMFEEVNDAFDLAYAVDGKFERAHRKLDRILSKESASKEKPPKGETEEQMRERLTREIYDKEGLTLQPTGSPPSGGKRSWTRAEIDNMTDKEWRENKDAINLAYSEGRVKE